MKQLLTLLLVIATLFAANEKAPRQKLHKAFTLTTVEGTKIHVVVVENGIKVKEYPTKVIILDFFGKNCPPCRTEMPILGNLQKKKSSKLQILGLHVQEPLSADDIKELHKRGINYPIVDYMSDRNNKEFVEFMAQLTRWEGSIPYMLFFDKDGRFAGHHLGTASLESLEDAIDQLYDRKKQK